MQDSILVILLFTNLVISLDPAAILNGETKRKTVPDKTLISSHIELSPISNTQLESSRRQDFQTKVIKNSDNVPYSTRNSPLKHVFPTALQTVTVFKKAEKLISRGSESGIRLTSDNSPVSFNSDTVQPTFSSFLNQHINDDANKPTENPIQLVENRLIDNNEIHNVTEDKKSVHEGQIKYELEKENITSNFNNLTITIINPVTTPASQSQLYEQEQTPTEKIIDKERNTLDNTNTFINLDNFSNKSIDERKTNHSISRNVQLNYTNLENTVEPENTLYTQTNSFEDSTNEPPISEEITITESKIISASHNSSINHKVQLDGTDLENPYKTEEQLRDDNFHITLNNTEINNEFKNYKLGTIDKKQEKEYVNSKVELEEDSSKYHLNKSSSLISSNNSKVLNISEKINTFSDAHQANDSKDEIHMNSESSTQVENTKAEFVHNENIIEERTSSSEILENENQEPEIENVTSTFDPKIEKNEDLINHVDDDIQTTPINSDRGFEKALETVEIATGEEALQNIESFNTRKCCKETEIFSSLTFTCESVNNSFVDNVKNMMHGYNALKVNINTGLIDFCPTTQKLPTIHEDILNSFFILPTGELYDLSTEIPYNASEYCLELMGTDEENVTLILAFCPRFEQKKFDYPDSEHEHEHQYDHEHHNISHLVRKCCENTEFYNTRDNKCSNLNDTNYFPSSVQQITFTRTEVEFQLLTGLIPQCPDGNRPNVNSVTPDTFRLEHTGMVIEVSTGVHYNVSHYCLELVGSNIEESDLTLISCSESHIAPKCCPAGKYFDEVQFNCLDHHSQEEKTQESNLIYHFRKLDAEPYIVTPLSELLKCERSFPLEKSSKDLTLNEGHLCDRLSCYDTNNFCVDFIGSSSENLRASALYCKRELFYKCCPEGEILSDGRGCEPNDHGNSILLTQLFSERTSKSHFNTKQCSKTHTFLDQTTVDLFDWYLSEDGSFLNIKSETDNLMIDHYCVDDYINKEGAITSVALVCEEEVSHLLPFEQRFSDYSRRGSVGKCCPQSTEEGLVYHLSSENRCTLVSSNQTLSEHHYLREANFSREHYQNYPTCDPISPDGSYHKFQFKPGPYDYARIDSERAVYLVKTSGECIAGEKVIEQDMCIEYTMDKEDGLLYPSVIICAKFPLAVVFTEKFLLVTILLGISSVCLFITLINLLTARVRRGIVTVRKVNTLAGRILVSFVSSNLIGFIGIVLVQQENALTANLDASIHCYILAGFVQFFNLATFCWNTSICLESLLLTIHISISEGIKYILHSLWAWGFPFAMTLLMFLMDYYENELPCWVVSPKIAVTNCFFSNTDHDALFLYFYLPILITIIANVSFLIGAKLMRKIRLKNLENGRKNNFTSAATPQTSSDSRTQGRSGMRIHQHHNAKMESIRIVLWTGGLWFIECLGYIVTRFSLSVVKQERWYDYLWYIPTCMNSLRGVAIFYIVVLTPEKRKEIVIFLGRLKHILWPQFEKPSASSRNGNKTSFSVDFSNKKFSFSNEKRRNMSVTTVISTLSSSINLGSKMDDDNGGFGRKSSIASYISTKIDTIRKKSTIANGGGDSLHKLSVNNNNNRPKRKLGMVRSVSQIDRRFSIASSTGSFLEELEMKEDSVRRKYSMNPPLLQLPKLQEEESIYEDDQRLKQFPETDSSFNIDNEELPSYLSFNSELAPTDPPSQQRMDKISEDEQIDEDLNPLDGLNLSQVTRLSDHPHSVDSEITLTELDIDLEPLELEVPVRFPFRMSSSSSFESREPNMKKVSAASWTDIDLKLPDEDNDSGSVDV